MVEFKEATAWRKAGAPPVHIPAEIEQWMDKTYADNKVCEMPAEDDKDTEDFIRLLRIYANRKGKKATHQFFSKSGESYLRFRMEDKRPYTRTSGLPREKR